MFLFRRRQKNKTEILWDQLASDLKKINEELNKFPKLMFCAHWPCLTMINYKIGGGYCDEHNPFLQLANRIREVEAAEKERKKWIVY